jgi:transglutaminase-like putative cysteine protease
MRLDIRYVTTFEYDDLVRESQNELRACPTSDERQQLLSYRVTTTPSSKVLSTVDYWGTRVDAFGVRVPHAALEIVAEAVVDTSRVPPITAAPRMAALGDPEFVDRHSEYLQPSPHCTWGPGIEALARTRAEAIGDDLISVVLALHRVTGTSLRYVQGATYVGVPVDEVLDRGEGVCQDYAHVALALCRSIGIPARYVSGYLFTVDDSTGADAEGDVVNVQTHAWVEAAIPGVGWFPLDPTNQIEVGERHVKIGHGRDYDDVPPLKGVFSGPGEHDLSVAVEMRRMGTSVGGVSLPDARSFQQHQQQQ